ncbi:GNAT family N-acetyltransferase [Roseateles koreensis]|uniref:GNAT family N-acetyltransferase n=1 Tax=Roseateles koreensis TaxID=2987526 RepID=A0ABT5KMA0_9BURK|nr:GNAT family N-acetyltransferase [Roseateles koreensis]MDC8783999.1 GNAT family N-acetyltransferase [Roseateles koreensis]
MHWRCQRLGEMSAPALYEVLALRAQVFVVEQACVYLDPDGLDLRTWHLQGCGIKGDNLQAYARLLPPLTKGPAQRVPMIGRVVTSPDARATGLGRALMQEALRVCERLWPGQPVDINAQAHLQGFYASLGFAVTSAPYDEDGISHIDMRKEAP